MTMTLSSAVIITGCYPNLFNMARTGGPNSFAREQMVFSDLGYWVIDYTFMLKDLASTGPWRAMAARLKTGEDIYMRVEDVYKPVGHDESGATAETTTVLEIGDMEVSIQTAGGLILHNGAYFSIANRLYIITEINSAPGSPDIPTPWVRDDPWDDDNLWLFGDPDSPYEVEFLPPIRTDVTIGTTVEFDNLYAKLILDDPKNANMQMPPDGHATPQITFREAP